MNRNHYHKAKKRVKKVKSFYTNLFAWAVISAFLVVINMLTMGPRAHFWAIYPILGWGLGVIFQAYEVFGFGKDWEDKMILEEMQKQREKEEARGWMQNTNPSLTNDDNSEIVEDLVPLDDELELKEFRKIRKEWDEQDYV